MTGKPHHVLFICTHNSARSILAEGLMNHLGRDHFRAFSAGSRPSGNVNPQALKTLQRMHIPADGLRSKDWNEFAHPDAPQMDFVFTVCDNAAGEICPVWPGQPLTAHWGVPAPSAAVDAHSEEDRARAFWDTALILKRRIELMLALPMASLDRLAMQREIKDIGTR